MAKCDTDSGTCLCHGDDCMDTHNITSHALSSHTSMLEPSVAEYYFMKSDDLVDEQKDIFEQTARMFNHMSIGDVIGFVVSSLVAVVLGVVVILFFIRMCRQGKNGNLRLRKLSDCFQLFWHNSEWTVSAMQSSADERSDNERNPNKDKMLANIVVNMRMHDNQTQQPGSATFIRSEMPPVPNNGRIVSIPGNSYIDDSPFPLENPDFPLTVEGTVATTSVERTLTIEPCSIANTSDSVTDSHHRVTNFDDDPYSTARTDQPLRRRLVAHAASFFLKKP